MNNKNTIKLTNSAISKLRSLIKIQKNPNLGLRVYISSGGCNGFKYGFMLDNVIKKNDIIIYDNNLKIIVDNLSMKYLAGGSIDYIEKISGSNFIVKSKNFRNKCSCGVSFNF